MQIKLDLMHLKNSVLANVLRTSKSTLHICYTSRSHARRLHMATLREADSSRGFTYSERAH